MENKARYKYDRILREPSAPILDVYLSHPANFEGGNIIKEKALLDTGADMTAIPKSIIDSLNLIPINEEKFISWNGDKTCKYIYAIRIMIEGLDIGDSVIPVTDCNSDLIFLGRNILNNWSLFFNGPKEEFEIIFNI